MDFDKLTGIVMRIQNGRNIHQHLDLIAGLPYEDYTTFKKSLNDVYSLAPDQLQLGFLKVLKGAYMHEMVGDYGCRYRQEPPYEVLSTRWLSYDEIILLKHVDKMVDIYYNSGQFTRSIPVLVNAFETPFDFYLALGRFYEIKGYEVISHSRIRRYDILLEFAKACNECLSGSQTDDSSNWCIGICRTINIEQVIEEMTIDLYLREKLKKAPAWALDLREKYEFDYEHRDPLSGNAKMIERK